jgi:hypothetical protein
VKDRALQIVIGKAVQCLGRNDIVPDRHMVSEIDALTNEGAHGKALHDPLLLGVMTNATVFLSFPDLRSRSGDLLNPFASTSFESRLAATGGQTTADASSL